MPDKQLRLTGKATTKYSPGFERFWECYPARRFDKPQCFRKWTQCRLEPRTDEIIALLAKFAESDEWTKDAKQFVPNSYRWLRSEPWEGCDIPPATKKRDEEHRARLRAERRQADHNVVAKGIAEGKSVEDEWAPINNWWEDLGAQGQRELFAEYAKANHLPAIERFVKVWGWNRHRASQGHPEAAPMPSE